MHHRHVLLLLFAVVYYGLGSYALFVFDAGLLATSLVLFGLPALVLAHFSLAPVAVLASVVCMGLGIAVVLEGTAHVYGLWYSLGITELRFLGILPIEMIVALTMQILFLVLVYEVLFDDGAYTSRSAYERSAFFIVFSIAALGLIVLLQVFLGGMFLPHAYLWLIGSLVGAGVIMLMLHRSVTVLFLDRVVDFVLIASIPSTIGLWLTAANTHKVFAFTEEYIDTISVFGQRVPLEEMALVFVLPFFIAVVYELYLDDQA